MENRLIGIGCTLFMIGFLSWMLIDYILHADANQYEYEHRPVVIDSKQHEDDSHNVLEAAAYLHWINTR